MIQHRVLLACPVSLALAWLSALAMADEPAAVLPLAQPGVVDAEGHVAAAAPNPPPPVDRLWTLGSGLGELDDVSANQG